MLKKKLGAEIIEERIIECHISWFYKVPPTLIIPENVKGIRFEVFDSCKKLKKVIIPGSVKRIEKYAFCGCIGLKEVVISDGVEYIGNTAFYGCSKLERVVVPESVVEIGKFAFAWCQEATIILRKPESEFKLIGDSAFKACKYVKEETRN